jgi:hypothetical protein
LRARVVYSDADESEGEFTPDAAGHKTEAATLRRSRSSSTAQTDTSLANLSNRPVVRREFDRHGFVSTDLIDVMFCHSYGPLH